MAKRKIIFQGVEKSCQPISFVRLLHEYSNMNLHEARDLRLKIPNLEPVEILVNEDLATYIAEKSEEFGFHCTLIEPAQST